VDDPHLLPFYSFDTSAIINGRRDIFLAETFGSVWEGIEHMIALGQVRAVDEVKHELAKKSDEAAAWAKGCKGLFVPLARDIQIATSEILAEHPRLLGIGGPRNGADPFVIALAHARGGTVVTQEVPRHLNKPRIPDVCAALQIPWMTLPQFVNSQGWTLVRGAPRSE
jgi:hypothetical protein